MSEKVATTLSKEDYEFLKDLSHEMRTQDNRATADPYYYVIKTATELVAPRGFTDRILYVSPEDCAENYRSKEEFNRQYEIDHYPRSQVEDLEAEIACPDTDVDKAILEERLRRLIHDYEVKRDAAFDELEEYSLHLVEENTNFFLTQKGYEKHMDLNSHNYRRSPEKPYSYVEHAFRNPEVATLFKILKKIGVEYEGEALP